MTTALAQRQNLLPDTATWQTMLDMAGQLVQSGLLPQAIKSPAAALAIIQKGQELGLPPMYALSNIGIINGKPVVGAEVLLAMIYRDHGDQAVRFEDTDAERCALIYKRRSWAQARRHEFTIAEADQAGLLNKGGPWKQYPAAMLRARCISAVARLAFPDSIGGLYTPEELGAEVTVTDDGAVEIVHAPSPVVTIVPKTADITPNTAPEPADEVTRAKFEAHWTKGAARAIACGIAPDDKPLADATNGALNKAQRELLDAIVAREKLNAEMVARVAAVRDAGGEVSDVDPTTCTTAEVHEMLDALADMLAAAPDESDEAF